MREHTHVLPGEEGYGLAWQYTVKEECKIEINGKLVLYAIADVVSGSVCVGIGAVRFIAVFGFIKELHFGMDSRGRPVSKIVPVIDKTDKTKINLLFKYVLTIGSHRKKGPKNKCSSPWKASRAAVKPLK